MHKKRGYFVHNGDIDQGGFAVVATSVKEARKIAYDSGEIIYGDTGYISIRAIWQRDADVEDLPIGMVHDVHLALLRNIYGYLEEYPCDVCGKRRYAQHYDGQVLCECCIEKAVDDKLGIKKL